MICWNKDLQELKSYYSVTVVNIHVIFMHFQEFTGLFAYYFILAL